MWRLSRALAGRRAGNGAKRASDVVDHSPAAIKSSFCRLLVFPLELEGSWLHTRFRPDIFVRPSSTGTDITRIRQDI